MLGAIFIPGAGGERFGKAWLQCKRTIEPCEGMAQIASIEIDQAEDIASGIAPRGKIRILLDLRDRLLARAGIEQGKGFRDRGLEKLPAAKLITVIEAFQLFNLGNAHCPCPSGCGTSSPNRMLFKGLSGTGGRNQKVSR